VSLAGTLAISLIDGYVPAAGDSFRVLTAGSRTGHLRVTGGVIGGGVSLEPRYDATGLTLVAVSQTWSELLSPTRPPARESHAAAWDPSDDRMIVFGGRGDAG
jgi:hypothetical protein